MERLRLTSTCVLVVEAGDLTRCRADAIVNAANEGLLGGGGVDGAIHRAAGPELLAACKSLEDIRPGVRCATGEARVTPGFRLPARHVIHTVGPVYRGAEASAPLLRAAYTSSLRLASKLTLRSVAFPAISCGVYGYPLKEAAALSLDACRKECGALEELHFVLFGEAAYAASQAVASQRFPSVDAPASDGAPS